MGTPSSIADGRRRGTEILDDPEIDPRLGRRSLRDIALSNRLFGGTRAVLAELATVLPHLPRQATLLDVGTGLGDIPAGARTVAEQAGVTLTTVGLEVAEWVAAAGRARAGTTVVGDGLALPFADGSVDVVTCSQVLHHFFDDDAARLVRELDRVARRCVIVSEIRRSRVAAAGIWAASFALGFHPVSRHDGVVSVMRGFTARELGATVHGATGRAAAVQSRAGFRVTASWAPAA